LEKQAYNVAEVAKIMGVCKGTVERLIREGKLRALRPSPRRIIIPLDAIRAFLNDRS
jgi:DNA binding domain, excisionase family